MHRSLRGRPRLDIDLEDVVQAVRERREVLAASRRLGCSDAYIHGRLKRAGLTLRDVLEAETIEELLQARE